MKKALGGFTLIEILLFLAITSALFIGIAAGTQSSVYQQRFMDATQGFAEFLRTIYSEAANVQNEGTGRSTDKAIYGKVVTFETNEAGGNDITMYSLVGNVEKGENCTANKPITKLSCLKANVIMASEENGVTKMKTAGYVEDYTVRWDSRIETNDAWGEGWSGDGFSNFEGIIIVTHSPDSGSLFTYVLDKQPVNAEGADSNQAWKNQAVDNIIAGIKNLCGTREGSDYVPTDAACQVDVGDADHVPNPFAYIKENAEAGKEIAYYFDDFEAKNLEFCVNPNGYNAADSRRNVRIIEGAHNATGVEISIDEKPPEDYDWNSKNDNNYNLCR